MKTGVIFLFVCMGLCVQGLPINDKEILSSSCIEMTPQREQEIHKIVEEVNGFIETLSDKHEDIDFTLVKLKIEKHYDDEHDEKETVLKIVINDCKNADTKTRKAKYLDNNFVTDDNSKLAEETSSEDKTDYSDATSPIENHISDFEHKSGRNLKVKERSKINENDKSEKNNAQSFTKLESGEETAISENDNRNESREKNIQPLQDDEIETLIEDLEDLKDKQRLSDSANGVYIFAPNIDNSKVELNNQYDELFKDLYKSAIQKLTTIENELEKIKQAKTETRLSNFNNMINKFDRNGVNHNYGFGRNLFNNDMNDLRNNGVYGNTGLELIYV